MSPDRFAKFFEAYQDGTLNGADARELHDALEASPELLNTMLDEVGTAQALAQMMREEPAAIAPGVMAALRRETQKVALRDRVMSRLKTRGPIQRRKSSRSTYRPARRRMEFAPLWAIGAAACVLLALGLVFFSKQPAPSQPEVAREVKDSGEPDANGIQHLRARLDEADRRRVAVEADLLKIQKQQAELAPNAGQTPSENPRSAPDADRARVLAELDERRRAAQKELELANHQRHEATQLLTEAAQREVTTPAPAVQKETKPLGKIAYAAPESVLIRNGIREPAQVGKVVQEGDQLETAKVSLERKAALGLTLFSGATVDLSESTSFKVIDARYAELQRGLLYASVEKDTSASYKAGEYKWVIRTPSANVGILGTRFDLQAENAQTRVQMEEGTVSFFNARGSQTVGAFRSSSARAEGRPSQPALFATESLWRGRLAPSRKMCVEAFTLADCDTARAIPGFERIGETAEIRLSALNARNYTLVARTFPEEIGSITFSVNGTIKQVESVFPYCISTDTDGRARAWNLKPGTYEIIATPYTGLNASGTAGQPLKTTLKVFE